jgi:hypothetical protein
MTDMANGYDIQTYEKSKTKAYKLCLEIEIISDKFKIPGCGNFETVDNLFYFLYGYETGIEVSNAK